MVTRRNFIKLASLYMGSFIFTYPAVNAISLSKVDSLMMPEESELHERTWMSFVANDYIWSKKQIPEVKRNLAYIARTIAKYEPVSMLVSPNDYDEAVSLLNGLNAHNYPIELIQFTTDDLWLRDTGPTFVRRSDGKKYGINFNFNGWGEKQEHSFDSKVADFITRSTDAVIETTNLTLEGGCFEIDGHGTAILTKSCVINNNRNPNMNQIDIEKKLKTLLGIKKIIWLEGVKNKDITDGHTDFYARFSKKGVVIVNRDNYKESYDYDITRQNIEILEKSTDVDGNKLKVVIIDTPDIINEKYGVDDFAAGYIGYYACNNAIIMQKFGDKKADENAYNIIKKEFPNRTIEQISIDGIASGGGTIHCSTQQEPEI
jgi:agmatine deiminase